LKYIEFVNKAISQKILESERVVIFGQNISAGSCLSGLTRNLQVKKGDYVINTPNCENTQCGVGFGLMINGVSSIFFMKQQDFLLLGIDHLVNTYNFIRRKNPLASFTIVTTVVDNGYQGLQSSLNNLGDFCSIARVPGFTITNKEDVKQIINSQLITPGFRIIGVSQRLFKSELIEIEKIYSNKENTLFQYTEGNEVTIVCFNFSFPYGFELYNKLKKKGIASSLFSVNAVTPINWDKIIKDLTKTKKLVVMEDSKSENLSCYNFLMNAYNKCQINSKIIVKKDFSKDWLSPNLDQLEINYDNIIEKLVGKKYDKE